MLSVEVEKEPIKQVVDSLFLVDEALINISEDGLKTRIVDKSNVAKAQIDVESAAFDSYDAEMKTMGVDVDTLRSVIKRAQKGERIWLNLVDDGTTLKVDIAGQEFYISLIDPHAMTPPGEFPNNDSSTEIVLDAQVLQDAVSAADMFSEEMTIKVPPEGGLLMEASGDSNRTRTHLSEDNLISIDGDTGDSTFSLQYLKGIQTALNGTETVHLGLDVDRPLHVEFEFVDGFGDAEYFIAPKIVNN